MKLDLQRAAAAVDGFDAGALAPGSSAARIAPAFPPLPAAARSDPPAPRELSRPVRHRARRRCACKRAGADFRRRCIPAECGYPGPGSATNEFRAALLRPSAPARFLRAAADTCRTRPRDVAVLLAAQQISRAAQFQIERGDFEARAQVGKFAQRGQPFARDFAQLGVLRDQQIRIRAPIGPPHAPAQLVQLGEAVALGVFDDDGVGERNIQAVFDDGGGDEHVVFVAHEAEQHALQLAARPSGRGPRRCGSWEPVAGSSRRAKKSNPRDCGRKYTCPPRRSS